LSPIVEGDQVSSPWVKKLVMEIASATDDAWAQRAVAIAHLYVADPSLEDLQIAEKHLELWSRRVSTKTFHVFRGQTVERLVAIMDRAFYQEGPKSEKIALLYRLLTDFADPAPHHHGYYIAHLVESGKDEELREARARLDRAYWDQGFVSFFLLRANQHGETEKTSTPAGDFSGRVEGTSPRSSTKRPGRQRKEK
jgi:hypothetical protein